MYEQTILGHQDVNNVLKFFIHEFMKHFCDIFGEIILYTHANGNICDKQRNIINCTKGIPCSAGIL